MARTSWGLDASVLRVTHDALMTSLLRYGLVFTGPGFPDDLMNRIDTGVINVASRRITGLPRITRKKAPHFALGTHSIRNLSTEHCGHFLFLVLERHAIGIKGRVARELQVLSGTRDLYPSVRVLEVAPEASFVADSSGVPMSVPRRMRWMTSYHRVAPNLEGVLCPGSLFLETAPELSRTSAARRMVYGYEGTHSWMDVGLQALFRVGWRLECSRPQGGRLSKHCPRMC